MFKGKFLVLTLVAAALLCWQVMPASVDSANSGIVDPCSSLATTAGGGCCSLCPAGDGTALNALGAASPIADNTITVTVNDQTGAPVPGIPAADFWVVGCSDLLALCGGSGAINATAASDVNGQTTMVGALAAGGCDPAVSVVVQGAILLDKDAACVPLCLSIYARSPDTDGSGDVGIVDFTLFGAAWEPGGGVYDVCQDYACNGSIDIVDFTIFGSHWLHLCN